jgi:predicted ester cyclase
MMSTAFPDLQVVIENEIAEGAKVVQRATTVSIMKDEFQGILPTGK